MNTRTLAATLAAVVIAAALISFGFVRGDSFPPDETCYVLTPTADTAAWIDYQGTQTAEWIDTRFDEVYGYSVTEDAPIMNCRIPQIECDTWGGTVVTCVDGYTGDEYTN